MIASPAEWVFWSAVALIVYTYVGFPLLVLVRGILLPRPYRTAEITPTVSMIIAAYNEADCIASKLENVLSLDYPSDRLEVIVASDGSSDDTELIARTFEDRGVRVLGLPRRGKAAALNDAVAVSTGEVLVFSDASSMYEKDSIRALVRPLADPDVGGVAGDRTYVDRHKSPNQGEQLYWGFDQALKRLQSLAGSAIGASGAIYSIRRSLFRTVPEGVTDDFVTSTGVIAQGYRLVFAPDAIAYEPPTDSNDAEFGRKVRVMTRGLGAVRFRSELLNPFRHGFYAVDLLSHKVLRRLMVYPLLVLLPASLVLAPHSLFYGLAAAAQLVFYCCAALGCIFQHQSLGKLKIFALPYFFCLVNTAALMASWNVVRGYRVKLWEPAR